MFRRSEQDFNFLSLQAIKKWITCLFPAVFTNDELCFKHPLPNGLKKMTPVFVAGRKCIFLSGLNSMSNITVQSTITHISRVNLYTNNEISYGEDTYISATIFLSE